MTRPAFISVHGQEIAKQLKRIADALENLTRDKVRNKPDTSPDAEGYWDIDGPDSGDGPDGFD